MSASLGMMEAALGPLAHLRPRLKPGVEAFRHFYRGLPWYVFHDRAAHRFYRVSQGGADIVGAMDGRRSLGEICEGLEGRQRPQDPQAAAGFVMQLGALGLLQQDGAPDTAAMAARKAQERRRLLAAQFRTPLSFKLPLFDPTRLVDALLPWCGWMFRPLGITLWFAVVLLGGVLGAMQWEALTEDLTDRLFSAQNLLLAWLVYPVVKALHELMHAITLRRAGVEVRQVGLLFAAFIPVPYVDASASATLERKGERMLIGAAGILVELFLGALALILWSIAEPGLLRAICYNIIMISGFSTLLFNGNPLQRYDGYYILADWLEIPGLGTRSAAYLGSLVQRHLLGRHSARVPMATPGEKVWFILYGPLSFVYRFGLMLVIALHVASFDQSLGLLLAAWSVVGYLWPMLAGAAGSLRGAPDARGGGQGRGSGGAGRLRALGGMGLLAAALGALLFLLPVPHRLLVQGYVTLPEESIARAGVGAMLDRLLVPDGAMVEAGQPLAQLAEPAVPAKAARLAARLAELEARHTRDLADDRVRAAITAEELAQAGRELADARRDVAALQLRSPAAGQLVIGLPAQDLPGRFLSRGEQFAMVYRPERALVRALVPMSEIDALRHDLRGITLRPAYDTAAEMRATLLRLVPAASDILPSPVLSLEGGGPFAATRDGGGQLRMEEPAYEIQIRPEQPLPVTYLNGRIHLLLDLGTQPLAWQIWREVRLVFLRHLHA
ncbi:hypothetical protein NON00_04830 [Roseomonas sp. GC11]|uniref:hypothetical protein n=1 Tax=Roseomonas sp. GC11 TaxID=2950546 RepID=UPI002109EFA2|nr:hypothetical protein [Roseomonas sp. GC11]MCQ4159246.1 hypothetical protein [Roseomonas sp. GC11]